MVNRIEWVAAWICYGRVVGGRTRRVVEVEQARMLGVWVGGECDKARGRMPQVAGRVQLAAPRRRGAGRSAHAHTGTGAAEGRRAARGRAGSGDEQAQQNGGGVVGGGRDAGERDSRQRHDCVAARCEEGRGWLGSR